MSSETSENGPFRSFLFAPGNHSRRVEKALNLNADVVILDLEDAVALAEKVTTRAIVVEALHGPRKGLGYVRVNAYDTDYCFGDLLVVIADGAHSLGARYRGRMSGNVADFTVFSFHAVKNLTTAEGGAVTWRRNSVLDDDEIYRRIMLLSLHGQTKDALAKTQSGSWEYDIAIPGWKHNMADLNAAIGLAQLRRYDDEILSGRKQIATRYHAALAENDLFNVPLLSTQDKETSYHLYLLRIEGYGVKERDDLIKSLAERGIPTNVHYKPLPMFTAYAGLGYLPDDHPVAMSAFASEITLPLHNLLNDHDVEYITSSLIDEVCG